MRFKGKIVLVSGAASGIGLGIARKFIVEGASVIGTDINGGRLQEVSRELGESFSPRECDAGSPKETKQLFHKIPALDVLVNNAGIGILQEIGSLEEDAYDRQLDVLLKGPIFHAKYAAPFLRESRNGSVVNIASIAALMSLKGFTAYGVAKAAVVKFTNDAVITMPGIRHNVVLPGIVDTPALKTTYSESELIKLHNVTKITPIARFATPDDIANAVLFLASDDASFITGTSLVVDGGLSKLHAMAVPD